MYCYRKRQEKKLCSTSTRTGTADSEQNRAKPGTPVPQPKRGNESPAHHKQVEPGDRNTQRPTAPQSNLSRGPGLPAQQGPSKDRGGRVQPQATQGNISPALHKQVPHGDRNTQPPPAGLNPLSIELCSRSNQTPLSSIQANIHVYRERRKKRPASRKQN
jgi:hypothetical protein